MSNTPYTPTLTPDDAVKLGLMRPISDQDIVAPILQAFIKDATPNFGFYSFVMTLLQVVYHAGFVEGVRYERRKRHG